MTDWTENPPARTEIDKQPGAMVLEFGTSWCGHCRRAQPLIDEVLAEHPQLRYLKVADGPGQPLGRSFGVKLWPTLVFLRDGIEVAREVRPQTAAAIRVAVGQVQASP
jgi:thioredoxin 1